MTEAQFRRRWMTIDYNRLAEEGRQSEPPEELAGMRPREAYGRNGKGRHAVERHTELELGATARKLFLRFVAEAHVPLKLRFSRSVRVLRGTARKFSRLAVLAC